MVQQGAPFVGREAERQRLGQALARAAEGSGSVVLVSGEAGIGKTRLCDELRREHIGQGGQALLGRAAPEEAGLRFGPLGDTLRAARRGSPPLWAAAQARAVLLWAVVPELGADGAPARSCDYPVLFEALLDAVDEAAGGRTTLWVLDDLHWADDSTWAFVRYAARRVADLSLVLVATYRGEELGPAHPWWAGLVRLQREPDVLSLPLQRLPVADAARLARAVAPALPAAARAEIVERSAGTPLLVEELARLAVGGQELPAVPDVVRATVRERAARLGPPARELLDVAAVAGLEVEEDLLATLRPGAPAGELVAAGLLEPDGGLLRFRHPLLQDAAYVDVAPERRRAMHEEVAAALGASEERPVERVAAHLERGGQPAAALEALRGAAGEAQRAGNRGRAATLRLAALHLAQRWKSLAAHRGPLERAAIDDLYLAWRWSELDPLVRGAWARRDRLPAAERGWLAGVLGLHLFWTGAIGEAGALFESEMAHLASAGRSGSEPAPLLLVLGGLVAYLGGDDAGALPHLQRALEAARRTGDTGAEGWALELHNEVSSRLEGDREAALARFREQAAESRARGFTTLEAVALCEMANYTATVEDAELARQTAERAGAWLFACQAQLLQGAVLLFQGQVEEAESLFVRAGPALRLGNPTSAPKVDVGEALLYLHRGEVGDARRVLYGPGAETEAAGLAFWQADRAAAQGWLAWEEGDWEGAVAHLARSAAGPQSGFYQLMVGGPIMLPLHVDALLRLGRGAEAGAAVERAAAGYSPPARFFAAGLAAARFRLRPTPEGAAQAAAQAGAAPWPWLGALVGCWRAELLGDALAAQEARQSFERIGAHCERRAEDVLRRLGARTPSRGGAPETLSPRELEVAELVAEGLSNPAIARRLFLSRPTVASHVAHILTKLGFTSRAQIGAWVGERRVPVG